MTAKIINGKQIALNIINNLKPKVEKLNPKPCLAVIIAGYDPASLIYVKNKARKAVETGFNSIVKQLDENVSKQELLDVIDELNDNPLITGILLQLPLPSHLNQQDFLDRILPQKDVDGFNSYNMGKLLKNEEGWAVPCTPRGIIKLLENYELDGKIAVVVGRSVIVGKPAASMLLNKNATVICAHSKTFNLAEITRLGDILICASGKKEFIKKDMIKNGAIIIDVGISRKPDGKLCGDVDFEDVIEKAGAITPVPGGVGPMTIASLMENTYELYLKQKGQK